jgi:hypothetical protein
LVVLRRWIRVLLSRRWRVLLSRRWRVLLSRRLMWIRRLRCAARGHRLVGSIVRRSF